MKPPSITPAYVCMFPILAEIAQSCGYALAVHGSVTSDLDVVAIPWTDQCVDGPQLVFAIWQYASIYHIDFEYPEEHKLKAPEVKPHGRLSYSIPLYAGAVIDLSVMPCKR